MTAKACQDILWTQREGERIRLGDMTHTHLANTISMVRRDIERLQAEIGSCYSYSGGDMAEMYAEQAENEASQRLYDKQAWLSVLRLEQNRRASLSTVDDAIAIMPEAICV